MAEDDFDPQDPPDVLEGHPLHDYLRPPAGLAKLATVQVVLAALIVVAGVIKLRSGQPLTLAYFLTMVIPCTLLAASGLGLRDRVGWGWWLTAVIYYSAFFTLPIDLALWTIRNEPFSIKTHLVVFAPAVFVLAYITRPEILRFIRFATPDGKPRKSVLISPALVGLGCSILLLVRSLMKPHS